MVRVVVINGGNVGDVAQRLMCAEQMIAQRVGRVVARSGVYRSAAWGFDADEPFLNQVLEIETELEAEELLDRLQAIEQLLGREREQELKIKSATGQRYTSRTMDIDILLYGEQIIHSQRLVVPHPRIREREFVLRPMAEIMPERIIPQTDQSVAELLERLGEEQVEKLA